MNWGRETTGGETKKEWVEMGKEKGGVMKQEGRTGYKKKNKEGGKGKKNKRRKMNDPPQTTIFCEI